MDGGQVRCFVTGDPEAVHIVGKAEGSKSHSDDDEDKETRFHSCKESINRIFLTNEKQVHTTA